MGFAHRGLHGPGVPENSLAAFRAAIALGAGIECDLRLTACGTPIVFHDRDTRRLCGTAMSVPTRRLEELADLRLGGTDEPIPTLAAMLALVAGRVPLLLELKHDRNATRFAAAVAAALRDYDGPVGVMSFSSRIGAALVRSHPEVRRGQVFSDRDGPLRRFDKMRRAQPHFVATKVTTLDQPWAHALRARLPLYSWTVRDAADRQAVERWADAAIWEADGRP